MRKTLTAYAFLLVIGGAVVLADQATKHWVKTHLALGEIRSLLSPIPWVNLVYWHNRGMAFGLGQTWGTALLVLGAVYVVGILLAFPRIARYGSLVRWAIAIQWGGALGNLLDRWRHGVVTDFIMVGRFPVFNLADAAISLSVVLLLLNEWLQHREETEEPETPAAPLTSSPPSDLSPHEH